MSDLTIGFVKPRTDEDYEAAIEEMLAELRHSEIKSRETKAGIKRLKAETKSIKAETAVINAQIQASLDALIRRT